MNKHRDKGTYGPIMVCIDADQEGTWSGRFYLIMEAEEHRFQSLTRLLLEMEQRFDREQLSPTAARHHDGPPIRRGRLATFTIQVLYRQHESWQGMLTWHGGHSKQTFRSVLELLKLVNGALNAGPLYEMKETITCGADDSEFYGEC